MALWTLGLPGLELHVLAPPPVAATTPLPPPAIALEPAASVAPLIETPVVSTAETRGERSPAAASRWSLSWQTVLWTIWGGGALLLAVRLAMSYLRLLRLPNSLQPAPEAVVAEVERVAAVLACRRAVTARISPQYAVPFLYGLRRPTLVLPERMCEPLFREQLPAVVAHELVHVGSWDFAWNVVLQVVSVVLWFHPLAWRIVSAHRAACDEVCDAVSAAYVGDVRAYCRMLARVALDGAGSLPAAGLAMARRCDVRQRIAALQRKVFAAALGRRWVAGVTLAGLTVCVLLAGLRLALAQPAPQEQDAPAAVQGDAKPAAKEPASNETKPSDDKAAKAAVMTVRGTVLDEAGKPVAGAKVCASEFVGPLVPTADPTRSDAEGRFVLEAHPRMFFGARVSATLWIYAARVPIDDRRRRLWEGNRRRRSTGPGR